MRTRTPPKLIPLPRAAELAGIPATTLREWCRQDGVPGAFQPTPGRVWLIPEDQIEKLKTRDITFGVRKVRANSPPRQTLRHPAKPRPGWRPAIAEKEEDS